MAPQHRPDHPADVARRSILLDALLGEIRHDPAIVESCYRWDERLQCSQPALVNLERCATIWKGREFQRDVARVLRRMGFPETVAVDLAPRVLYVYLDWAGVPFPADPPKGPPPPPFLRARRDQEAVEAAPIRGKQRRGPRKDAPYQLWAHWFYRVDVLKESQHAVWKYFGPYPSPSKRYHKHGEDCVCSIAVRRALKQTRSLLGVQ